MTQQERQMIDGLIQRVQASPLADKDPDAEQMLQQGLARNPNALYVLAQTVLVQGYALEQAQKQLLDLKAQLQSRESPAIKHTSFLGSIFGSSEPERPTPPPSSTYMPVPSYSQSSGYAQPQNYPPPNAGPYPGQGQSSGGGFLRGAMQTAAGVAAGAVAFEGIESLMHGFGGGHGGSSSFGNFGGNDVPREEVVNNYYGDSSSGDREHGTLGDDVEDRRDDALDSSRSEFADTGDDQSGADFSSSDDTASTDDSDFS